MAEMDRLQTQVGDLRQQMGEALGMLRGMGERDEDRRRAMERLDERLSEIEQRSATRMQQIEQDLTALRRDHGSLVEQLKATSEPLKQFAEWQKSNRWLGTALIGAGLILTAILQSLLSSVTGRLVEKFAVWFGR
jgi:predicted  nucleic acid-binding Zn-ribbon protein